MRVRFLIPLLFVQPLIFAQGPSQVAQTTSQQASQNAQMGTQQAQRDAAEAQRQADVALQAHQQATRLAQNNPPLAHVAVTKEPSLSPKPGTYSGTVPQVTIADRTKGAVIYFTTDGSIPTVKSQQYTGPFSLSSTTTVKAMAVAPLSADSPILMGKYVIR
jgi:hypothetical protein